MQRRRAPERFLATVLLTDIADSTRQAVDRGDRDWRGVLERHYEIVRTQLRRFGGREIDSAGDGFFATFDTPARAVACALEIVEATAELGIRLRAGAHTGEVEAIGPKVGGIAVHIAARILAAGQPGEVWVSSTIRDLVAGAGIEFEDRGEHELRGLPGSWRLFAATGGAQLRADALAGRRHAGGSTSRAGRVRRDRRPWVIGAMAIGAVAATALVAAISLQPRTPTITQLAENAAGIIDLRTGAILGAISVGARPAGIALTDDAAWVTDSVRNRVSRVNLQTRAVVDSVPVGSGPTGLAVGFDAVWAANSGDRTVSRISVATNEVVQTITVGNGPVAVAVGPDAVWVANRFDATVSRIDPGDGRVTATIGLPATPAAVVATEAGVWVAAPDASTVFRIDPASRSIVASIPVGNGPQALAVGSTGIWVANAGDATVSRIDPVTDAVRTTIEVGPRPTGLAASGGELWVACSDDSSVYRVDADGTATRHAVGSPPNAVAAAAGELWLTTRAAAATHRGGTLRVVSEAFAVDTLDPAIAFAFGSWSILNLTNDGLVGFARVPGVAGTSLVPNLAASVPVPTDGGRTYAFRLRPGLLYSTGEPIVAGDFRHGIERVFGIATSAEDISNGATFLEGIVGAEDCLERFEECDLSAGIVTDDAAGTITIRLGEPDPDFLHKLALPFASAVPAGVASDAPSEDPVPATGPYRIETASDSAIRLTRNPSFKPRDASVRPDGYVDEIVWTLGPEPNEQLDLMLAGEMDWMFGRVPPERIEQLRTTRPAQLHAYVQGTVFAWLNTSVPPFDDIRVRQAVNYAIDRSAAVAAFGGPFRAQPTCQVVPPNFIGYVPYCPYTAGATEAGAWTGRDLEAARQHVDASGQAGAAVDVVTFGPFERPAEHLVEVLDELGFDASLEVYEDGLEMIGEALNPATADAIEAGLVAWFFDYPAASSLFVVNFGCDEAGNLPQFCDPALDALIDRATALQQTDHAAAGLAWSEVDRAVVDAAPWVPMLNIRELDFVGDRVGNYGRHPQWGVLLDQVWVQ